jgi:hypothetical protein
MPATALNRAKVKVPVVSMISNLMSLFRLHPDIKRVGQASVGINLQALALIPPSRDNTG